MNEYDPAVWHRREAICPADPHARPRLPAGCVERAVRGVLFDMGDVLHDASLWRRWLLRVLNRIGVHTNYRSLFRLWDRDYLAPACRGEASFADVFRQFLRAIGLTSAQIDEVDAACQARRRHLDATSRALPGVKVTLSRLRQRGMVLGVVSNTDRPTSELQERLDRFGLAGQFEAVVSSVEIGFAKPDPRCYLSALDAMGLPPQDVAFVGHDTDELAGACDVGMTTVAFNFDRDAVADVYVARFEEVYEVLPVQGPIAMAG